MGIYEFPTWLQVTAWYLFAAGAIMLLLAMFWDRPRGRLRCPRCWYDMAGAKDLKCPECGHVAKSEPALRRIHRRYGWAILGLILLSAPAAEPGWRAYKLGTYWRWMPRRVLIYALMWGVENRGYWSAFEEKVIEPIPELRGGSLGWYTIRYKPRNLSSSEESLLLERIIHYVDDRKKSSFDAELLELVPLLKADSPRLRACVLASLSHSDLAACHAAFRIAVDRGYSSEEVLTAVLPVVNRPLRSSILLPDEEEFLSDLASFLGKVGATDPRVVPTLMKLHEFPKGVKWGYRLHTSVQLAFADLGTAASEASGVLAVDPDRPDPRVGVSPTSLYAFWMVSGRFRDRGETLVRIAERPQVDYAGFVARELGRIQPCEQTTPLLRKLLKDQVIWVRDNAARSVIRLSLANAISDQELLRQACKILKDDSEQNFDAFWQTCDFVVEMGLDPAPLEAMVPQFRKDSHVPRGNIDMKAQGLSEYRRLQRSEPFTPW